MKKLLLILITCCQFCLAQSGFNKAYQHTTTCPHNYIVQLGSRLLFSSTTDFYLDQPNTTYLHNVGLDGSELPPLLFAKASRPVAPGIKTLDNCLVMVGTGLDDCSDTPKQPKCWIAKIDQNNQVLFNKSFTFGHSAHLYKSSIDHLIQLPDSGFISFEDIYIHRHDKNGNWIATQQLNYMALSAPLLMNDSSILVSASTGLADLLIRISAQGNVLSTKNVPTRMKTMAFYGNGKIVAGGIDGKLYKISTTLDVITSVQLSPAAVQLLVSNDTVYINKSNSLITGVYEVRDSSLNVLATKPTTTYAVYPKALCKTSENKIAFLSRADNFLSLNYVGLYAGNNFAKDISLTRMKFDTIGYTDYSNYRSVTMKLKATIKNTGSLPVSFFKLNCVLPKPQVYWYCGENYYCENFEVNAIQPGDSITVTTTTIVFSTNLFTNPFQAQHCFYTSVPDSTTDNNLTNDAACITKIPVGLTERTKQEQYTVFPNPCSNELTVESPLAAKFSIYNASGSLCRQLSLAPGKHALDITDLAPGFYFCESDVFSNKLKIIKQ